MEQGKLPNGWWWVRLGEVITEAQSGFACGERAENGVIQLRMNNVDTRGNLVWTRSIRVPADSETVKRYELAAGDVVFNNTNSTELVGKSAVFRSYREPVVYSNHFTRLKANQGLLDPNFLANWLVLQWQQGVFADLCNRWIGQSAVKNDKLLSLLFPLPPLSEQQRIAGILGKQMAAVERARAGVAAQRELLQHLIHALLRQGEHPTDVRKVALSECLTEITTGVGERWREYPVLGATRGGLAPAKEAVGKSPQRYKLVEPGTVFYNPMRILLGSIAMVDDGGLPGITSPDYVVFRCRVGMVHPRWFYYWLRSDAGAAFIKTLARGAVRERMLFRRLAAGEVALPSWDVQVRVADALKAIARARVGLAGQAEMIEKVPAALLGRAFGGEV